jgi:hypothetical protein
MERARSDDSRVIPPKLGDPIHRSGATHLGKPKLREKQDGSNDTGNSEMADELEGTGVPPRASADEEEDTGWDSEHSDNNPTSETTDHKKRLKSSKQKNHPRGRRHSITHKKWPISHAERFVKLVNPFEAKAGNRAHGRPPPDSGVRMFSRTNSAPSTQPSSRLPSPYNSRPSSLRNLRLEQVRYHASTSRDVSPSRSIRFADDGNRSGSSTPRISFPLDPSSPSLGDERSKVTFAVPD